MYGTAAAGGIIYSLSVPFLLFLATPYGLWVVTSYRQIDTKYLKTNYIKKQGQKLRVWGKNPKIHQLRTLNTNLIWTLCSKQSWNLKTRGQEESPGHLDLISSNELQTCTCFIIEIYRSIISIMFKYEFLVILIDNGYFYICIDGGHKELSSYCVLVNIN